MSVRFFTLKDDMADTSDFPHFVIARFFEHIEPIDRGDRYEDPLNEALEAAGIGRVTGGGSQLTEVGRIEFADIEIELADLDAALQAAVQALERAGAPQGSEIHLDGRVLREFGAAQCVAVYLDGVSLPEEVYAALDFDQLIAELDGAAGSGSFRGHWQGPEETGLFFFGPDAEELFTRIHPALLALPIGQNARVVVNEGKAGSPSRTVRLPRR
jgi:hypothetical protein